MENNLQDKIKDIVLPFCEKIDKFAVKEGLVPQKWQITEFTDVLDGLYQMEDSIEELIELQKQSERARLRAVVEKMKKDSPHPMSIPAAEKQSGYNRALDDVLDLLKGGGV